MHMLNMRIIGIIMQLAEYEVFMPMDPFLRAFPMGVGSVSMCVSWHRRFRLSTPNAHFCMIFHFFGVFCGIFYLLLPFFKHTDEVNEKIGVLHVAQRFDRALAVCLDDALAAVET